MKFRIGGYTIAFETAGDRGDAVKMIEAMEWQHANDNIHVRKLMGAWWAYDEYGKTHKHPSDTPWDAILAAKEASNG